MSSVSSFYSAYLGVNIVSYLFFGAFFNESTSCSKSVSFEKRDSNSLKSSKFSENDSSKSFSVLPFDYCKT